MTNRYFKYYFNVPCAFHRTTKTTKENENWFLVLIYGLFKMFTLTGRLNVCVHVCVGALRSVYTRATVACHCFWNVYTKAISANQVVRKCFRNEYIKATIAILHLFIVISVYCVSPVEGFIMHFPQNGRT